MDSILSNQMEYNTKKKTVAVALSSLTFKGEVCNVSYVEKMSLLPSYSAEANTNKQLYGLSPLQGSVVYSSVCLRSMT